MDHRAKHQSHFGESQFSRHVHIDVLYVQTVNLREEVVSSGVAPLRFLGSANTSLKSRLSRGAPVMLARES